MAQRTCSVDGCDKRAHARGWCKMHYARVARFGAPGPAQPVRQKYTSPTCSVDGCDRPTDSHDMCGMHCERWKAHGDPTRARPYFRGCDEERLRHYADTSDPDACWLWRGRLNKGGYGEFGTKVGGSFLAHRASYHLLVGPIPDGLTLDHLCRVPACVNPAHLEPVTLAENARRAAAARVR